MIEGAMEKPIDEIRYPNVAKKTRRLMILATVDCCRYAINAAPSSARSS